VLTALNALCKELFFPPCLFWECKGKGVELSGKMFFFVCSPINIVFNNQYKESFETILLPHFNWIILHFIAC